MRLTGVPLVMLAAAAAVCAAQAAARAPLRIGAVVPELLDPTLQDSTIALMKRASLADTARVTITWQRGGQTSMDPGLLSDLRNGIEMARASGIDVYLDAYPNGSSQTPNSAADQAVFAAWLASVVGAIPGLRHVIVGNEPNLNLFWLPQFTATGADAAAIGYEHLLARTYDAVKRAAPGMEVVGGTLAHSGADRRNTGRDDSPAQFVLDMGAAYRASHRTKPIMDSFSYHPYMERSDLPPTTRHIRSKTLTIADYGRLVSVLKRAFDGTAQKGRTLPLVYDEFGVEAKVPPARASLYTGTEPSTTHPVTEAAQASYYAQAFHLAACQPTVRTIMVFRLIDSPFLESFQSGVYYADRQTSRSSLKPVAAAANRYRAKTIAGCAALLAPRPIVSWPTRTLTCDTDCAYDETFERVGVARPVLTLHGTGIASVPTRLPTAKLKAGRYRIVLRVRAVDYRANAFTTVSPAFG